VSPRRDAIAISVNSIAVADVNGLRAGAGNIFDQQRRDHQNNGCRERRLVSKNSQQSFQLKIGGCMVRGPSIFVVMGVEPTYC
jgi:hypothetical protein